MESNDFSNLTRIIEADFNSRFPKYPDQAKYLIQDKNVITALSNKLANSQALISIKALPYNFTTGLHFTCFAFSSSGKSLIGSDNILIISNGDCKVVGLVDPFDAEQPNPWVPPLPAKNDPGDEDIIPFALARPSALNNMRISKEDLFPMEVRSTAFFARLGGRAGIFGRGGFNLDDGSGGVQTTCTYVSGTMWEGPFPGMGNRVFPRQIMDSSLDDCAPA